MKRILILVLCFIPLLNAADNDEEIERTINGTTYKGHILGEEEHANINFIGIQKAGDKTTIIARARGTFYPFFNDTELFAQYSFHGDHNNHDNPFYLEHRGPFIIESAHFNPSDFNDYEITLRAFELFRLYNATHAKRTALKSKSDSKKPMADA
jgi:hypothetical protein